MIIPVAEENFALLAIVLQLGNLSHDLEGLFVGFRAGIGKIYPGHAGHFFNQLL